MTRKTAIEVKSVMPVSWMGRDVFHVTSTSEVAVLMRFGHRGWHACSSKEEAFNGALQPPQASSFASDISSGRSTPPAQ